MKKIYGFAICLLLFFVSLAITFNSPWLIAKWVATCVAGICVAKVASDSYENTPQVVTESIIADYKQGAFDEQNGGLQRSQEPDELGSA